MNTEPDWEYYGHEDVNGEVTELYRMPAGPMPEIQKLATKERLHPGLVWIDAGDDPVLRNEFLTGWFDFQSNRLTEERVASLMAEWAQREKWPGRP